MSTGTISAQRSSKGLFDARGTLYAVEASRASRSTLSNLSCTLILNDVVCAAGQQEEAIEAL